jgi:hypothetical protein
LVLCMSCLPCNPSFSNLTSRFKKFTFIQINFVHWKAEVDRNGLKFRFLMFRCDVISSTILAVPTPLLPSISLIAQYLHFHKMWAHFRSSEPVLHVSGKKAFIPNTLG